VIGDEAALPSRYDRTVAQRRAADAQRQLDRLGKVNPLALEEYEALTERHTFLATQLDDLRKTRRDLLTVVKEVDDRVQEVFASAYADTAREFEQLFGRLFPGGQGNLVLTEPDDMLATGIEIEARPPGKKVKRLSLLSGGERSLTAIAYLFAIFKARPSPFYVLDEVEAALDDTNLQRLLLVFDELRESSQLIVITHQRRTMEAAEARLAPSAPQPAWPQPAWPPAPSPPPARQPAQRPDGRPFERCGLVPYVTFSTPSTEDNIRHIFRGGSGPGGGLGVRECTGSAAEPESTTIFLRRRLTMGSPQARGYLVSHGGPRTGGRLADDLSAAAAAAAAAAATPSKPRNSRPPTGSGRLRA
jgi:hypothetical protein